MNRRLLLTAGSGVLGVAVLNTVTGCGSSPSSTSPAAPETSVPAEAGLGDWHRADLSFVSAWILVRGGEAAVVDTGTPGSGPAIEAALKAAGSGWDRVRHLILTHQHQDHAGGLAEIVPSLSAKLYAGGEDVASIVSDVALTPVADGDDIFGLRVVGTPGHTLGHISLFEPATGVLVAGDALRNQNGLEGSAPEYTADATQAVASVRKLAGLPVRVILPGHGDPLTSGAADTLQKLAATL
ncbi:MBL fold metallo-hydrolase [Actinoplanes sp. NBRC 101535]|uniref:MBL fold metallo-hydrolase n=1 Tax=Actinoplanes sp. NBRC 101535 TaxID=3032196 RepID=UPI0025546F76|nr:MBL fold metallo-hydrolase [Actinoplanes sp. NBRC 101535]